MSSESENTASDGLDRLASDLGPVNRNIRCIAVKVDVEKFDAVAGEFYDAAISVAFLYDTPTDVISRRDFQIFYRWALKMRLDRVLRSSLSIIRPDAVPFCSSLRLFGPLAQLINNFGVVHIRDGTRIVVPTQPDPSENVEAQLEALCTPAIRMAHRNLMCIVTSLFQMRTELISSAPEGTAFWMLKVVGADGTTVPERNADSMHIAASFSEWTPRDAILAAIMFLGVAKDPLDDHSVFFTSGRIAVIAAVRRNFFWSR